MEESNINTGSNVNIKKERRKFARFLLIALAVSAFFLFFGKGTNVRQWIRARGEIHEQMKQKETYLNEIDEMDRKINQIKSSKDSLEKFAREKFRFAEKGEDVYIIR